MQIALTERGHRAQDVLACVSELIRRARAAGVPVVHVQHHHASWAPLKAGAPTWKIHPDVAPAPDTTCRRAISLGYDVTLVADGHTTRDGVMPAAEIIRHHNAVLPGLVHPDHHVTVVPGHDVRFEERPA
jgi:nicotinamidase-related amidase